MAMAEDFANDFQALTGVRLHVATGTSAQEGDIFFTLGADKAKGLKDEGYLLDVTADRMTVTAEAVAGANWGGKTILQGMKSGAAALPPQRRSALCTETPRSRPWRRTLPTTTRP